MADDLVAVAKVVRPRGLKGEVVAEILTDFPERFDALGDVSAIDTKGGRRELKIEGFWFQNERIVLKFAGHDSVEEAERLRDLEICVDERDVVELDEGEFFDWQLEGLRVETVEGRKLGIVREVMRTGGTELLVVEDDGREYLIPFVEAICVEVDIDNQIVRVDLPEGLLEF